jgi:subtilisin family serine protease
MRTLAVAVLALVAAAPAGAAAHRLRTETPHPAPRVAFDAHTDLLVQLNRAQAARATPLMRGAGAELLSPQLRIWRIRGSVAPSLLPLLRLTGAVATVEPDRPLRTPADDPVPPDPLASSEYWLAKVGADRATPPGPGKPVTIVDTGVDITHPEFAARPDTTLLNAQHISGRDDDHGTGVASVAAAPVNGVGLQGVYPEAVLQAWDASPSGNANLTIGDEVRGITTAAAKGQGVINLSLGSEAYDRLEEDAILTAFREGSIVVASAGNEFQEGNPVEYPASLNHVLTIGATDENDQPAFFSSSSNSIDLAAPGQDIPIAEPLTYDPSGYSVGDGTSYSAPIVSGATAWVWTVRSDLDNTQMFELMRRSARDVWDKGYDEDTGFGVLDIPHALTMPALPPDPQEPNDDITQVKPRGLFAEGRQPLNSPAKPNTSLRGRLDASEDPDDVYRVYVPAGRAVVVYVSGDSDVDLDLWGVRTQSVFEKGKALKRDLLAFSERPKKKAELVRYVNRNPGGITLYADVFLGENVRAANYSMSVTVGGGR